MEALDHMDELLKGFFGAGHRSNTGDGSNQVEQASNKDDADIEGLKQNVSFRPDEEEGGDEVVRVVDEWTANDASGSSASEIVVEVAPEAELELCLEHYFRDHFTLSTPSTLVRFRPARTASRVFEDKTSQFILEESIEEVTLRRRIQVKQLSDGTSGLQFLRLLYTVMCVFWTGIFFVLCLQILLVMVLEMAIHVGTTGINDGKVDPARVIGYVHFRSYYCTTILYNDTRHIHGSIHFFSFHSIATRTQDSSWNLCLRLRIFTRTCHCRSIRGRCLDGPLPHQAVFLQQSIRQRFGRLALFLFLRPLSVTRHVHHALDETRRMVDHHLALLVCHDIRLLCYFCHQLCLL